MEDGADPRELWPDVVERNAAIGRGMAVGQGGRRYERHGRTGAGRAAEQEMRMPTVPELVLSTAQLAISLAADAIARQRATSSRRSSRSMPPTR